MFCWRNIAYASKMATASWLTSRRRLTWCGMMCYGQPWRYVTQVTSLSPPNSYKKTAALIEELLIAVSSQQSGLSELCFISLTLQHLPGMYNDRCPGRTQWVLLVSAEVLLIKSTWFADIVDTNNRIAGSEVELLDGVEPQPSTVVALVLSGKRLWKMKLTTNSAQ